LKRNSTNFDRRLRVLVLEGLERIEVAIRMRIGYVLGRRSAFAYEDPSCFVPSFTAAGTDIRRPASSRHVQWLQRVSDRQAGSDEQFVEHFRDNYDDRMPVWALTEILELGHLSLLYRGLNQVDAEEIALALGVPTKRMMTSWLASLNYVRNVAAHHARLFNRKLQNAPSRPKIGQIPLLDHLRDSEDAKRVYGTYNALAVIAYLLHALAPLVGALHGWDFLSPFSWYAGDTVLTHGVTVAHVLAPLAVAAGLYVVAAAVLQRRDLDAA